MDLTAVTADDLTVEGGMTRAQQRMSLLATFDAETKKLNRAAGKKVHALSQKDLNSLTKQFMTARQTPLEYSRSVAKQLGKSEEWRSKVFTRQNEYNTKKLLIALEDNKGYLIQCLGEIAVTDAALKGIATGSLTGLLKGLINMATIGQRVHTLESKVDTLENEQRNMRVDVDFLMNKLPVAEQVQYLAAKGLNNTLIASRLNIDRRTIGQYLM